jgi:hypothetical protein
VTGRAAILVPAVLLAALALAACGGGDGEPAAGGDTATAATTAETDGGGETTGTAEEPELETTRVRVYFVRGEWVGPAAREVRAGTPARAALEALLAGPTPEDGEAELTTAIPAGTRLLDVGVADRVATVDLSGEYDDGGGTLSMSLRLAQVVYTLTQFESIDSVLFRLDGVPVEAFGGEGILLEQPVDRGDFEDVTPAILVESPLPWETVESPLRIEGTANTFEANFHYEVTDTDGRVVANGFVTATSGTGFRGTFEHELEFDPGKRAGVISLIVFEPSAEDGSRTKLVEVPLRVER